MTRRIEQRGLLLGRSSGSRCSLTKTRARWWCRTARRAQPFFAALPRADGSYEIEHRSISYLEQIQDLLQPVKQRELSAPRHRRTRLRAARRGQRGGAGHLLRRATRSLGPSMSWPGSARTGTRWRRQGLVMLTEEARRKRSPSGSRARRSSFSLSARGGAAAP